MKVGTDGVLLGAWAGVRPSDRRMLDIGTGTGLIALMLAQRSPEASVTGVDIDDVSQARENADASPWGGRVVFERCPVQEFAAPEPFDLIVSNPPYVTTAEMETLDPSVRDYEPHLALWGGDDGLDFYRAIVRNFTPALNPGGWLCFEFGMGQDAAVCDLLRRAGYEIAELKKDTADITRAVLARKREEG